MTNPKCLYCGGEMENAFLKTAKDTNAKVIKENITTTGKPKILRTVSEVENFIGFGFEQAQELFRQYAIYECTKCPWTTMFRLGSFKKLDGEIF